MSYNPLHLYTGENPPSYITGIFASQLPPWTDARNYALPSGPLSLFAVTEQSYNPLLHGSHWQRLVNQQALAIEALEAMFKTQIYGHFLNYPGFNLHEASVFYKVVVPTNTIVSSASANLTAQVLPKSFNIDGSPYLDPNRLPTLALTAVSNVYDFYFGISYQDDFTTVLSGPQTLTLSHTIGTNEDGSWQIEWVTINGVVSTGYTVATDGSSITLTPAVQGSIAVHYTNYDLYYNIPQDNGSNTIYFRRPYFEVFIAGSNAVLTSSKDLLPCNIANPNLAVLFPVVSNRWTQTDDTGLLLSLERNAGETSLTFKQRLLDSVQYTPDLTNDGLRNALANNFGLVTHVSAPKTGSPTVSNFVDLASADLDSVLINSLPLQYYTVTCPSTAATNFNFPIPSLLPGANYTTTLQLASNSGPVVPGLVPLTYTTTLSPSANTVFDQILCRKTHNMFSAPTRPWYSGSLQLWKNGVALTNGLDYFETSTTSFTLAVNASAGDKLELGYIYDYSEEPLKPKYLNDYQFSPSQAIKVSAKYSVDNVLSTATPWAPFSFPTPDVAPNSVAQGYTWTTTFVATNCGTIPSSAFNINVALPPSATVNNNLLTINNQNVNCDVTYINSDIWIKTFTDPNLYNLLYTAQGTATNVLQIVAQQVNQEAAVAFPYAHWNKSYWISSKTINNSYSYVPNIWDTDYSYLVPQTIQFTGSLKKAKQKIINGGGPVGQNIAGQTIAGAGNVVQQDEIAQIQPDYSKGGNVVDDSWISRYPDFQSGIGYDTDLQVSIADISDVITTLVSNVQQSDPEQAQTLGTGGAITNTSATISLGSGTLGSQGQINNLTGTLTNLTGDVVSINGPLNGANAGLDGIGGTLNNVSAVIIDGQATLSNGQSGSQTGLNGTLTNISGTLYNLSGQIGSITVDSTLVPSVGDLVGAYPGLSLDLPDVININSTLTTPPSGHNGKHVYAVSDLNNISGVDPFLVQLVPGTYFLRQEQNYLYANAVDLFVTKKSAFLEAAVQNTPILAYLVDSSGELEALRQVYFLDSNNLPTLTFEDSIHCNGTNTAPATFSDLLNINVISSSDGIGYTVNAGASANLLTISPLPSSDTVINISYELQNSFLVTPFNSATNQIISNGLYFMTTADVSNGVLITYESGTGNYISGMPLHPYYNTRDHGFIYIDDFASIPTAIKLKIDPQMVEANVGVTYTMKATVVDANGAGVPNIAISIISGYQEGNHGHTGITDQYGNAYWYPRASSVPQEVIITAVASLYNSKKDKSDTISAYSHVKFYAPFI